MAFDPSIIMGYRGIGELPNPMNQLAQVSQIQSAQRQGEAAQMQLEDLKNDRIEMQKFQAELVANGGNPDLKVLAQTMLRSPKTRGEGIELMQKLNQQAQFETVGKKLYPELFGAEPTAAAPVAAPTAAPAPSIMRQPGVAPAVPVAPNALGTGMYGMEPTAPVNALAPTTAPAAAPVNALAAPTGKTVDQLRREIIMFSQSTDPRAKAMVDMLKNQLTELGKAQTLSPGQQLYAGGKVVYTAPEKDSEFERLLKTSGLSDTEKTALRIARAKKEATHAPGTSVYMPPQEKAFEAGLGTGQSKLLLDNKVAAQDAASIIDTVNVGRGIMKSGMITGAGADFLVNLNQGLKTVGIDAGYADAAANSQAFTATLAGNVGKLIKQFGAGTGLSDADREFAKDMAGGRIALDAKAIDKILNINERAARNVITRHNKDVKGIKTNIPLEVEMPPAINAPAAGNAVTNPQFPGFSIGKP